MTNVLVNLSDEMLEQTLVAANDAYRNSDSPVMADAVYDQHLEELRRRNPEHPLLQTVEPEADFGLGKVRHSRPMLSTQKAYDNAALSTWVRRIEAAAADLGMALPVPIKINAKLDGMAGRLEQGRLASRGDGLTGNDISHMLDKGLVVFGEGDGELVLLQSYFDEYLAEDFSHPRNVVTGAVGADTPRPAAQQALQDQAIHFVGYDTLDHVYTSTQELVESLPGIRETILSGCAYPTDGVILAVEAPELRDALGSTGHHHNYVLAAKTVAETAETPVTGIQWQVGRTGRLTPVVQVVPVTLSGALISNVTGHHAGHVQINGIGPGAIVEITRSGEVIPKILRTCRPALDARLPVMCPCCDSTLERQRDFLVCPSTACPDRLKARFGHFFHILGTIDLFGPVACERLVNAGIASIRDVFSLSKPDFEQMGFGPGQAGNLVRELEEAKHRPVDDFRVLAALGVEHLGRGDSKKLLKHTALADIPQITEATVHAIPGFGSLTARAITEALPSVSDDLAFLVESFTQIVPTTAKAAVVSDSPISGKHIVFTGTMVQGSRSDMIKTAETLGAISQSSVNKKTDFLVAGEKVGASKLTKAQTLGTTILSESEYLALIG